jgi:hypothetical protein
MYYQHPLLSKIHDTHQRKPNAKKHVRANLNVPHKLLLEDLPVQLDPSLSRSYFNRKFAKHHKEKPLYISANAVEETSRNLPRFVQRQSVCVQAMLPFVAPRAMQ